MSPCGDFVIIPSIIDPCDKIKNNNNIKNCPGGLPKRARTCLAPFPRTVNGFPFSGNINNPGSLINSVNRCNLKLQYPQLGFRENFLQKNTLDNFRRRSGGPGGIINGVTNF